MNMRMIIFLAMLMIGLAGSIEDLSGTDPSVFDQPKFAKDGVDGNAPTLTTSQSAFLANDDGMNATLPGKPVLLIGSVMGYNRTAQALNGTVG